MSANDSFSLEFYTESKRSYSKFMYNVRFKEDYELEPDTPTMLLTKIPALNGLSDNVHLAWCFACGEHFATPFYLSEEYHPNITCPICGRLHRAKNIRRGYEQESLIPTYIHATVHETKDCVKLSIRYEAVSMRKVRVQQCWRAPNGGETYGERRDAGLYETFWFDTTNNKAYWSSHKEPKIEIGYFNDAQWFVENSALYFLKARTKSKQGETFTAILNDIRKRINRRMKARGYQPKKTAIKGTFDNLVLDSILTIAHQVRFWDARPFPFYGLRGFHTTTWNGKNTIKQLTISQYLEALGYDTSFNFERVVEENLKGSNYGDALLKAFNLPLTKTIKTHINYFNLPHIANLYKAIGDAAANEILPDYLKLSATQQAVCGNYFSLFRKHYKHIKLRAFYKATLDQFAGDCCRLYQRLNAKNKAEFDSKPPKFKDLHDSLAYIINTQEEENFSFNISQENMLLFNREIGDYRFCVIEDSYTCKAVGKDLHNCAGGYDKRSNMGKTLFLVRVYQKRKLVALLEIDTYEIVQARLDCNRSVSTDSDINCAVWQYSTLANLTVKTSNINIELAEEYLPEEKLA